MQSMMRGVMMTAVAAVLAACGRGAPARAAGGDPALQQDLALATSAGIALAGAQRGAATQVVSAEELTSVARRPVRTAPASRAPRRTPVVARRPAVDREVAPEAPAVRTPEPQPEPAAQPEPAPQVAEAPAPAAEPAASPTPAQAPMPGQGGGASNGPRIPGIGVVIRGGDIGDDDHCQIRPGTRGRGIGIGIGGVLINVRAPIGRPTFPTRGPRW